MRTEIKATRIPVLNHYPYWRSHLSQAESSSSSGISLRGSNSPPTGITLPQAAELKLGCWLQIKAISLISLTTKAEDTKKQPKQEDKEQIPNENTREFSRRTEMEASNSSDREFRVMIIRILNSMKKDIETMKKDHLEIKNAISEINNPLEGIKSRLDEAEYHINDLEDMVGENTQAKQQK